MENINFLENLATRLGQSATVKNVYGEPIVAGDKTIIPVAQIMYGFGGGYDYGKKPKKFSMQENVSEEDAEKKNIGEGLGGGGGIVARPKGVYQISKCGKVYSCKQYKAFNCYGINRIFNKRLNASREKILMNGDSAIKGLTKVVNRIL